MLDRLSVHGDQPTSEGAGFSGAAAGGRSALPLNTRYTSLLIAATLTNRTDFDDKNFVERRDKPRFPANLIVRVTDLEAASETFAGSVVDISESGACVILPKHLIAGSTVKLELDDAVLYGHVTYAFGAEAKFRTGIAVEKVLLGTSDLSSILEALLDSAPRPTLRTTRN